MNIKTYKKSSRLTKTIFGILLFFMFFSPIAITLNVHKTDSVLDNTHAITHTLPILSVLSGSVYAAAPDSSGSGVITTIGTFLGNLILTVAAFFTWVAGMVLDSTLDNLVFGMGGIINDNGFGGAIDNTWKIIRDLSNLAFIFGFIYLGIRTIIDPESASVKRTLTQIIIAALLINFSLYIVKAIIDFSNLLAYHIYNAMVTGNGSLSAKLMDMLGLVSIYSPGTNAVANATATASGMVWFFIMGALLLFIAAFVFFAAAILLIVRFVALIFIMIASPILFAATVFPQTAGQATKLWKQLLSYSFFAPIYLLLTLITIILMDGLMKLLISGNSTLSNTLVNTKSSGDAFGVVVSFIVIIFFLIESLLIAKKIGIAGADIATSIGGNIRKGAQGYIGRGAMRLGGKYSIAANAERIQKNTTSKSVARITGAVTGAKFGSGRSIADVNKEDREFAQKKAHKAQTDSIHNHISTALSGTATAADKIAMERSISGASSEQVLSMADNLKGAERDMFIENLSSSQFDTLMKSKPEDFDDAKKKEFKDARAKLFMKRHNVDQETTTGGVTTSSGAGKIGKADAKELESMDFNVLLKHANHLSMKQIDDMKDLTPTAKSSLKDARKALLIAEFKPVGGVSTPTSASAFFARITNDTEISKLPAEILTDAEAAQHFNANILTKIIDNDSINAADRTKIKSNVQLKHTTTAFNNFFNTPIGSRY